MACSSAAASTPTEAYSYKYDFADADKCPLGSGYWNGGKLCATAGTSAVLAVSTVHNHDANGNMAVDRNVVYGYAYWEARVFSAGGFITRKNWTDGDAVGAVGNEWLNDEAGRLKSISGRITSLAYNARGQVTVAVYANGVTTTNAYNDQRGWLTNVSTVNRANF